ncbi:V-type ATPase subunit a family protein [Paenibacillus sp. TRM 82003]|nr:V-type ATPase subunit a family protein [Paenibacillus sp. TRM 82003]
MEKIITKFHARLAELNSRTEALREEKAQLEQRRNVLERARHEMTIAEALGNASHDEKDKAKLKKEIDALSEQIADVTEKVVAIEQNRDRQLRSEFADKLVEARRKEVDSATVRTTEAYRKLREMTAGYLLAVRDAYHERHQLTEVHIRFIQAMHAMNVHDFDGERLSVDFPTNLFNNVSGDDKAIAPLRHVVDRAIMTGQLPLWVEHYDRTGEVLTEEEIRTREARERMKEMGIR